MVNLVTHRESKEARQRAHKLIEEEEISNKNPALQNEMGEIKLKAVHPKGYIIFGRDAASFNGDNINQKKLDFELIKNTYKDVVDIITFDELVQRFDRIISFL